MATDIPKGDDGLTDFERVFKPFRLPKNTEMAPMHAIAETTPDLAINSDETITLKREPVVLVKRE